LIEQLCGKKYPDFALAVLVPMIESVEDVPTQARMWESTFNAFLARPDLAADLRMAEGRMFEKSGDYAKAGQCYTDVIRRFINSTSVAMAAVLRAETMLRKMDQDAKVLDLYKWASSIAVPPASGRGTVFEKESNWYKLHAAYEHKLALANGGSRSRTQ
jgi:hypothetical protein